MWGYYCLEKLCTVIAPQGKLTKQGTQKGKEKRKENPWDKSKSKTETNQTPPIHKHLEMSNLALEPRDHNMLSLHTSAAAWRNNVHSERKDKNK